MNSIRITIYAFTVLGALTGLLVLVVSAAQRQWYPTLAGLMIFVGFILLGLLGYMFSEALRRASAAAAVGREVQEIRERLNALEAFADLYAAEVNLAATGSGDPAPLVAATLERDTFPRIVLPEPPEDGSYDESSRAIEPRSPSADAACDDRIQESQRLRRRFGDQVRAGDYAGALATGDTILQNFPDSAMAREYQKIRPHLQARLPAPSKVASR